LFFARNRERRGKLVDCGWPRLFACRNAYQFWHRYPQGMEVGRFGFRVSNRTFSKLGWLWVALDDLELFLDRTRKTRRCVYKRIQRRACERRHSKTKKDKCPKICHSVLGRCRPFFFRLSATVIDEQVRLSLAILLVLGVGTFCRA
jgi:hypothetical protein